MDVAVATGWTPAVVQLLTLEELDALGDALKRREGAR
jgi:hypothetical protein